MFPSKEQRIYSYIERYVRSNIMPKAQASKPASSQPKAAPVAAAAPVTEQTPAPLAQQPAPAPTPALVVTESAPSSTSTTQTQTPAPAPAATEAPAEAPAQAGETKSAEPKYVRRQLANAVGIGIPPVRVRNLLAHSIINKDVSAAVDDVEKCKGSNFGGLSDRTLQYVAKSKPDPVNESKAETVLAHKLHSACAAGDRQALGAMTANDDSVGALSKLVEHHLLRIGDDAVTALAATAHMVVQDLALHGAKSLPADSKKTLQTYHIANDDIEKLCSWPFLRTLKCVNDARAAAKQRLVDLDKKAEEKKEKAKQKKKEKAAAAPTDAQAVAEQAPTVEVPAPVSDSDESKSGEKSPKGERAPEDGFKHHISEIVKKVVKDHAAAAGATGGDIGDNVRTFISHVVHELVLRYSKLIRDQTLFAGVKTIKAGTITTISRSWLIDSGVEWPELEKFVDARVKAYIEYSAQKPKEAPTTAPQVLADGATPQVAPDAKPARKPRAAKKVAELATASAQPALVVAAA